MNPKNLLPVSACGFVALVAVTVGASIATGVPGSTDTPAEVANYYREHGTLQFVLSFALAPAALFLVLFAVGLASARGDNSNVAWQRVLVGGSVATSAVVLVLTIVNLALADAAERATPAAIEALNVFAGSAWVAHNAALGVMLLGAAGTLLTSTPSRALGWTALVLGFALFVPFVDFFALLLTAPWMIATAVAVTRPGTARHESRQPAASLT